MFSHFSYTNTYQNSNFVAWDSVPRPPHKINVVVFKVFAFFFRFVVDGDDDGVQDSNEEMMAAFQAALEEVNQAFTLP
mgnify:CR=1 FL=1